MEEPLEIDATLKIPRSELDLSFARGGGPGGQNVNKVSSKVILRWSMRTSTVIDDARLARLLERVPPRYQTKEGEIVISASEHRDQAKNREAAEARLVRVLLEALARPKTRRLSKPGKGARARRRDSKERQADKKSARKWSDD